MIPTKKHRAAASRLGDFDREGVLTRAHQEDSKFKGRRSQYEKDPYTKYQNFMYKRALYGLSVYTKDEVRLMHWEKKRRIVRVHNKAQLVLNALKQTVTISWSNQMLNFMMEKHGDLPSLRNLFAEHCNIDDSVENTLTLRELQIEKTQVIEIFIKEGVLPKDFHDQKEDPHEDQKIIRLRKAVLEPI
jgi:hypothetical protein